MTVHCPDCYAQVSARRQKDGRCDACRQRLLVPVQVVTRRDPHALRKHQVWALNGDDE